MVIAEIVCGFLLCDVYRSCAMFTKWSWRSSPGNQWCAQSSRKWNM